MLRLDGLPNSRRWQQADKEYMIPCFTYTKNKYLLAVIAVGAPRAKMWSWGSVPQ